MCNVYLHGTFTTILFRYLEDVQYNIDFINITCNFNKTFFILFYYLRVYKSTKQLIFLITD